ncbi:class I SAM-dependent methyltransferase [Chlorobium phaeobacteroides]|uniref:Methyltransferase type 12 n=1 Tax=Chlorobium phaeobacteroides (strain DSM 266 / SMG 266 / 2430) TaxID=290317 RepID=A1BF26_CHLPD|nr:class I SAM-dependent methyltransferase [Chlorobium phaeobacteroides]ABL65003.1 Methyltransferase type 12 [Chlorobium phaeobacteroides DSM 266]
MLSIRCPVSDSNQFKPFLSVPDRYHPMSGYMWHLVESEDSGLVVLNPRPDSEKIAAHYRNERYLPHLSPEKAKKPQEQLYLVAKRLLLGYKASIILKHAEKDPKNISVLEIGCSTGDLLGYLHRKKGVPLQNLAGIEPDPEAAAYAENHNRITICRNGIGGIDKEQQFDCIIFWHVLEHIHDLHETLTLARNKLAKDGALVITLPNRESHDALHYREHWIAYDAPRHLYHFTPESLEKLLLRYRLSITTAAPYLPDTLFNTFGSEKLSCAMQNRSFHTGDAVKAVLQAIRAMAIGKANPLKASSLVYIVRKQK